ncbi:MAG: tetratricopeptide repeat protein [Candidatus Eremiobacteraeota bacterium]|nr:tetratricopeptide repeat protein [Candidatus Eremiobacteraeota bacterium]
MPKIPWAAVALGVIGACVSAIVGAPLSVSAQTYDAAKPVPRTTSAPALRALAIQREVHERFSLGLQASVRNDWTAAAVQFERILALKPQEPQASTAHYDLASAYAGLKHYDAAAQQLQAAIAGDPGFLAAYANLVAVDLARGDLGAARNAADRFIALAPESARALYSRGIVALRDGDSQIARSDFGKLLQSNPSYAIAHYDLALAESRLGRYDIALTELQAALSLAPAYARARFALGAVLLRDGQRAAARVAFDRAMHDAGSDPTLRNLAAALRDSIR